jgi:hypothetical protein
MPSNEASSPSVETRGQAVGGKLSTSMGQMVQSIRQRCVASGIRTRDEETVSTGITVLLPAGKRYRELHIRNSLAAHAFLGIQFEKIFAVDNYRGLYVPAEGRIEAVLEVPTWASMRLELCFGKTGRPGHFVSLVGEESADAQSCLVTSRSKQGPLEGCVVSIGSSSRTLAILDMLARTPDVQLGESGLNAPWAVTIAGVPAPDHERAVGYLEGLANALLLQIDTRWGILMRLARCRDDVTRRGEWPSAVCTSELLFPTHQYDCNGVSLFWYAREAGRQPLLQYVAYYNVLEYFFPLYTQRAATSEVQRVLKDPTFNPDKAADVARVLGAAHKHVAIRGFGDDKAGLRETIEYCVSKDDLIDFLTCDAARREFFNSKESNRIAQTKLKPTGESGQLISDIASRIYEIRCRIVHTKGSDPANNHLPPLFPFSDQVEFLTRDLELIEFVARRVVFASGSVLSL